MKKYVSILMLSLFGFLGCGNPSDPETARYKQKQIALESIDQIVQIEVTLRWREGAYNMQGVTEISPNYQEHRRHLLSFDHDSRTVDDKFWSFEGTDSTFLTSSHIARSGNTYLTLTDLLKDRPYLCSFQADKDCIGAALPTVSFTLENGEVNTGYVEGTCTDSGEHYQLCSKDLVQFIESLRLDR